MPSLAAARRRGFTLVELLIVLAIITILTGLLFPVFAAARRSAQASVCLTHFSQATKAALLYTNDYDDRLMPVNHRPGLAPDPTNDLVWPQILLPYVRDFRVFDCPSEPNNMGFGGAFDPDLLPGDYAARYYEAALHSDLGYNAYYLAPIAREGMDWVAHPKATTEADRPSRTFLFIESRASGGGSYLVSPPCRYSPIPGGGVADTFTAQTYTKGGAYLMPQAAAVALYTPIVGWDLSEGQTAFPLGGVGVRHNGRLNASRLDGSARSVSLEGLERGCDVRTSWRGPITDSAFYSWSFSE